MRRPKGRHGLDGSPKLDHRFAILMLKRVGVPGTDMGISGFLRILATADERHGHDQTGDNDMSVGGLARRRLKMIG